MLCWSQVYNTIIAKFSYPVQGKRSVPLNHNIYGLTHHCQEHICNTFKVLYDILICCSHIKGGYVRVRRGSVLQLVNT